MNPLRSVRRRLHQRIGRQDRRRLRSEAHCSDVLSGNQTRTVRLSDRPSGPFSAVIKPAQSACQTDLLVHFQPSRLGGDFLYDGIDDSKRNVLALLALSDQAGHF